MSARSPKKGWRVSLLLAGAALACLAGRSDAEEVALVDLPDRADPRVAIDAAGGFAVVWAQDDGLGFLRSNLHAQRFEAHGSTLSPPFRVNDLHEFNSNDEVDAGITGAGDLVVAWQNGQAYEGDVKVALRVIDAAGNGVGPELVVPAEIEGIADLDLAVEGDAIVVVWSGYYPGIARLARFRVDRGTARVDQLGEVMEVYGGRSLRSVGVDLRDGVIAFAYAARANISVGDPPRVAVATYAFDDGRVRLPDTVLDTDDRQRDEVEVALDDEGNLFVAWVRVVGGPKLFLERLDPGGLRRGPRLATTEGMRGGNASALSLHVDGPDAFELLWWNNDGLEEGGDAIYHLVGDAEGFAPPSRFDPPGFTVYEPGRAVNADGDFVTTWLALPESGEPHPITIRGDCTACDPDFIFGDAFEEPERLRWQAVTGRIP